MSYTPNTWKSGDVVTSAKLNNLEAGAVAVIGVELDLQTYTMTLTETWQTICDLLKNGTPIVAMSQRESGVGIAITINHVIACLYNGETYTVSLTSTDTVDGVETVVALTFTADTADDYPSLSLG